MLDNLEVIEKESILEKASTLNLDGFRFATMTCEQISEDTVEVTYHFDKNYELTNIRFNSKVSEPIKSISPIFPAAFLIENEFQDLYGVVFDNLIIDYKGNLYLTDNNEKAPMMNKTV